MEEAEGEVDGVVFCVPCLQLLNGRRNAYINLGIMGWVHKHEMAEHCAC